MLDAALLTCLLAGHAVDLGSTEIALSRGGREWNPLIRNRGVRISVNVGATVAEYKFLRKKSKNTKVAACGALLLARGAIAAKNMQR